MVTVSGKTYEHKEKIKALGLRWNPKDKVWYTNGISQELLDQLASLRGIIVDVDGAEAVDNRTHKQKYGQCEDAPCCGCCGQTYYGRAGEDY